MILPLVTLCVGGLSHAFVVDSKGSAAPNQSEAAWKVAQKHKHLQGMFKALAGLVLSVLYLKYTSLEAVTSRV